MTAHVLLTRAETLIGRAEDAIGMAAVAILAAVVNLQIFSRYLFHSPFMWVEEIARLLLVWMTFIGAAALTRQGGDLAVDTFVEMLPPGPRRASRMIRDAVMVVLFIFVATQGHALAQAVRGMPMVATELPTSLLAWPLVAGGMLTAFHCALRLLRAFVDPVGAEGHDLPKALT
ncbi:MAG: hypothetical protein DI556_15180 [Rhodovulum sulfidophilum]|uniref:TRAP transporter small permease protein n=1 Tax=Rhodovulum sulfidophilum TaxID=35806 RepID=A0A2W5N3X0_RHOSU|nr:MAG: hypothetical protein DI556_15180 [Rhodovulum sulfidophilum]